MIPIFPIPGINCLLLVMVGRIQQIGRIYVEILGKIVFIDSSACVGCGECKYVCPEAAVTLDLSALATSIRENRRRIFSTAFRTIRKNYWKIKPAWSFKKKLRTLL